MNTTVALDPTVLMLINSLLLPVVTGLITRKLASSQVKSLVLMLLSFVTVAAAALVGQDSFNPAQVGADVLLQFAFATAAHYGLLKPAGVTGSAGVVQDKVPGGLGAPRHRAS